MTIIARAYDYIARWWDSSITPRFASTLLLLIFLGSLLTVFFTQQFELLQSVKVFKGLSYFDAVNISFTALLIYEVLGLIFVLPESVADSVGKQFEILSIVLLRSAFKEFSHFSLPIYISQQNIVEILPMLADIFGALLIFLIIGFYYHRQKHERITRNEKEQQRFINFKKLLALGLLIAFLVLGFADLRQLFETGNYEDSLHSFYVLLIFTDVLILLYSIRYHSRYINLFRYSSFTFATVLIRLALSSTSYLNAVIGILAGIFVLGVTIVYNYFRKVYEEPL
jgi:hypothetical protein